MKKFKWISLILSATVVFVSILGCSSKPKTYTHGDWVIMHQGENECLLYDLTEQGKEKEVLIFPTEVDGRKVVGTYYIPIDTMEIHGGCYIDADNLKRLYFKDCVYLDKHSINIRTLKVFFDFNIVHDDVSSSMVESVYGDVDYFVYPDVNYFEFTDCYPANVVYFYNYNEISTKYYWMDDYDNEIIKYPPVDPVRDGYEFAGWYKEPECINKWNFEADIVPEKKYTGGHSNTEERQNKYLYNPTNLYAKWVEI